MGLPNIFISDGDIVDDHSLNITGDNAKHLSRSLRVRNGEELEAILPGKVKFHCRVDTISSTGLILKIIHTEVIEPPGSRIALCLAISKTTIMDDIVRQATELGVSGIVMFASKNSPMDDIPAAKLSRLQKIALEASKQSRRIDVPNVAVGEVSVITNMQETSDLSILLDEETDDRPISPGANAQDAASQQASQKDITRICVICGPEGGFNDAEKQVFLSAGAKRVKVGRNVLRTETAATAGLAVVLDRYLFSS